MNTHQLPSTIKRSKKRLGRGIGSGKGKTSGRGTKGQKARGSVSSDFSGGGLQLYKRIPYLRGSRNKKVTVKSLVVDLTMLSKLKKNTEVTIDTLVTEKIIKASVAKKFGVKILSRGEITVPLIIKLAISKSAAEKITKAGGRVE